MIDTNIVGHGGSSSVYRIELKSREVVAVKKLWSRTAKDSFSEDQLIFNEGLKTEVETLGNIRHKNIIKLYSTSQVLIVTCWFMSLCQMGTFGMLFTKVGSILTGQLDIRLQLGWLRAWLIFTMI
ncbi:hypothetical protein V6N13_012404 [Hibiscus sabdariffa]